MTIRRVRVDVATVWASPESPREIDAPAVAADPDMKAWTTALDAGARRGLHGRTLTQLVRGEPVVELGSGPAGWMRVAAPWQPAPEDIRGYPGWVRAEHLASPVADPDSDPEIPATTAAEADSVLAAARRYVGLSYLWGGTSPWGFDCSGLVHYCHRLAGLRIPRDAAAQHADAVPVRLGKEQPGDLYFFATAGCVHHVGFVTDGGQMLHAPEDGSDGPAGDGHIEEAPMTADRRATLVAVGRYL